MDARPKLAFVLALFLLSILISDIFYLAILLAFVFLVIAIGKVLRSTLGLMKYTLYVAIFVFLFSILFSQGQDVLLRLGPVAVTSESLYFAASMCLRLFLAIGAFSLLTFTVHPDQTLRILSKFGFKAMTGLSIATRMYPTIAADSNNISDAMKARGVEFDDGNVIKKAKARAPVIMPLLLNSMDRSLEIAEAMEARGFGAGKRTNYFAKPLSLSNKIITAIFLATLPVGISAFILGYGNADYIMGEVPSFGLLDSYVVCIEVMLFSPILLGGMR
jgi:energy-coupling factor transport system permease protein